MAKATSQVTKEIQTLADLTPDPRNARKHNPRNVGLVERALNEVGAARSIVIDESGVVLAGNATIEAAGRAGIEKVQVVDADGETIIAVRRTGLTQAQKTRLALFDNRTAELADWDAEVIASLVAEDDKALDGLFENNELLELIESLEQTGNADAEPQIDRAAELNEKWQVKPHDLWRIVEHRLLCGDCTVGEDVQRVMGGKSADIVFIDPPYSSGGFQEAGKTVGSIGARGNEKISNDNLSTRGYRNLMIDSLSFAKETHSLFIFCDWKMWTETFDISERLGYRVRNMIVWDKMRMGMGMPFRNQHELILFASKISGKIGDGDTPNVIQEKRDEESEHRTPKPIALMQKIMKQIDCKSIYDCFLGSGTTMVASENLQRKCFGIEISPNYCAVILERMQTAFPALIVERAK